MMNLLTALPSFLCPVPPPTHDGNTFPLSQEGLR
jgi:hypothetical protein